MLCYYLKSTFRLIIGNVLVFVVNCYEAHGRTHLLNEYRDSSVSTELKLLFIDNYMYSLFRKLSTSWRTPNTSNSYFNIIVSECLLRVCLNICDLTSVIWASYLHVFLLFAEVGCTQKGFCHSAWNTNYDAVMLYYNFNIVSTFVPMFTITTICFVI